MSPLTCELPDARGSAFLAFGARNHFSFLTAGFYLVTGRFLPWLWLPRKKLHDTLWCLSLAFPMFSLVPLPRVALLFALLMFTFLVFYSLECDYSKPLKIGANSEEEMKHFTFHLKKIL